MMRKLETSALFHAENLDRHAPDRARDAVAILVELRKIGRTDVLDDIHFHAVDEVQQIRFPQTVTANDGDEECRSPGRRARKGALDVAAPRVEFGEALLA